MQVRKIKRDEFEELYDALVDNLTRHAYESIIALLDEIEAMAEDGRLTPGLVDSLRELLQSLRKLLSSRREIEGEDREVVDESLKAGFSTIAELVGEEPNLIEDAVEILTELYDVKELLDRIQRRIVSLLDALKSYRELLGRGISEP
jgi:Mg2+ and Co2+ transporter CorA